MTSGELKAIRYKDINALRADKMAGSFEMVCYEDEPKTLADVRGIRFICPCGCGNESWLPTNREKSSHTPCWDLSGSLDAPTVRPSVFNTGMPCKWHGWLTDGTWKSV